MTSISEARAIGAGRFHSLALGVKALPGDINGDGQPDLLWQHVTKGQVYLWYLNGPKLDHDQYVGLVEDPNWRGRRRRRHLTIGTNTRRFKERLLAECDDRQRLRRIVIGRMHSEERWQGAARARPGRSFWSGISP